MGRQKKRGIYRSVYTVIFDSPEFLNLSRDAKQLLITLRLSRLTNMAHIFLCDTGAIYTLSDQTGMTTEAIGKAIDELCDTHWIAYRDRILWVRNGLKYEPCYSENNPKHRSHVQDLIDALPKSKVIVDFCEYYGYKIPFDWSEDDNRKGIDRVSDTLSNGNREPIDSQSIANRNKEQEQEQDKEQDKEITPNKSAPALKSKTADKSVKTIPDTEHHNIIALFCDKYKDRFDVKYSFTGSREAPIVKKLLADYGYNDLSRMIEMYFEITDDQWLLDKGFTVGNFKTKAIALAQKLKGDRLDGDKNRRFSKDRRDSGRVTL